MKQLFLAMIGAVILAGCGGDKGGDFVGKWQGLGDNADETITVEATPEGYRAHSHASKAIVFQELEMYLEAESDTLLVKPDSQKRVLVLEGDGTLTSFMRNGTIKLTRVN